MRISEKVSKMATNKIYCVVYIYMLATVVGGRKQKRSGKTMRIGRKRRSIQLGGMGSLSPSDVEVSGGMSPDVNFNAGGFPQKAGNKMVGGGSYGYTGGDEVKPFGGSYAPYSVSGGSESGDLTRGGNNILSGGGYRRRRAMRRGRGTMRRMRKWSMKGCMGTTKRRRRSSSSPSFLQKIFS